MLDRLIKKIRNGGGPNLKDFKRKHKGQRCFVMGNGPSLNLMDLTPLAGETIFASNGIYHLFPGIAWRPTYYACVDAVVLRDQAKNILQMRRDNPGIQCFFPRSIPDAYREKEHISVDTLLPPAPSICYFKQVLPQPKKGFYGLFPKNPGKSLIQPYTVTATLLQLAYLMGCNPIYLIGCDTHYSQQPGIEQLPSPRHNGAGIIEATADNDPNHFDPTYFGKGRRYQSPNVDKMILHYNAIQEASQTLGFKIFNAGIKSRLDVFPAIGYETLFAISSQ